MAAVHRLAPALLNKYNINGPRYTSYPTALEFNSSFGNTEFEWAVKYSNSQKLSLYIHIPFCHSLCYYCGCNKIVTRHRDKADEYLDYLIKEIVSRSVLFQQHKVEQIHFGGGTPSFLSKTQFSRLMEAITHFFSIETRVEMSIEIDPREIELSLLDHLKSLGFNRLSFGVQDTNEVVQKAINRVQDTTFIDALIKRARELEFESINLDLVYGLPHQTLELFENTLNDVAALNPDRISLFSYAHLPSRFAAQAKIKQDWLPNSEQKLQLMLTAIDRFVDQGYVSIGMDHFAKPTDDLAIAQTRGKLHRNFQGYTTLGDCDLLGLGVSAISSVGVAFSQNEKELKAYYQAINNQQHAVTKGLLVQQDDVIRGSVIKQLMCNFELDKRKIEQQFSIEFERYFADDLPKLKPFIEDSLVFETQDKIEVTQRGRLLVRNIAMSFDAYMAAQLNIHRYSRVI